MPRFRRSSFRRRGVFGGGGFRRGTSGWKRGRTVPNALTKCVDINSTNFNLDFNSGPPAPKLLNEVFQGAASYNRIGSTICMKSIYLNGAIRPVDETKAVTNTAYLRLVIVYDSQTNAAFPAYSDLIKSVSSTGAATSTSSFDQLNVDQKDRFKVICDKWIVMPAPQIGGAFPISVPNMARPADVRVQLYCKLNNLETKYKANAGGVGDIATGGLFAFCLDERNSNAQNYYVMKGSSRLRYCDI